MRILSDRLTAERIGWARHDAGTAAPETNLTISREWKPRKHAYGVEVSMNGWGDRHRRYKNSGQYGASTWSDMAATWMDWGWFIAVMFRHDPDAHIGQYQGRANFIYQTASQWTHRRRVDKSNGAGDFARAYAALLENVRSPFELVDLVAPPILLIDFDNPQVVETWLSA